MRTRPLRWAVVVVDLEPGVGHEQRGERRAVVVSYEPLHRGGMIAACPITTTRTSSRYPGDVPIPKGIGGQTRSGVILCHQVRTLSIERIRRVAGRVDEADIRAAVRRYLARHLGLDIPPAVDGATGIEVFGRAEL